MTNLVDFAKEAGVDTSDAENQDDINQEIDNIAENLGDVEQPQWSEAEEQALNLGWKPKDEWEGDADEWSSAKRFLQTREIIESNKSLRSELDKTKHDFDSRINNLQKFHEQSLKAQKDALVAKRDQAASEADMDAYHEANKQLEALETPAEQPQQNLTTDQMMNAVYNAPETQSFIQQNRDLFDTQGKIAYAEKVLTDWVMKNQTNPSAGVLDGLNFVKESINQEFKQVNPNRQTNQQFASRGKGPAKSAPKNTLTMEDLTREEIGIYNGMPTAWKDEAEFLQAVADSRKGE